MIIIGEKLNSSIPDTIKALQNDDKEYIIDKIVLQSKNGADYLDINTAACQDKETDKLKWMLPLIFENSSCGIMVDSPNTKALLEIVPLICDRKVIINSVTADERIDELLPLICEYKTGVVALPITKDGIPNTAEKRVENAAVIIEKLRQAKVSDDRIYLDVLAETLSVSDNSAVTALKTIKAVKKLYPWVNTICGLSNISFGLPKRAILNSAFLAMAISFGLDSAIMDITSPSMRLYLAASKALFGLDEYCMGYLEEARDFEK